MKLTAKAVAALTLPAGKTEVIFFDEEIPGLGMRLREGGVARWVYQYRAGTKQRRISLGPASAVFLLALVSSGASCTHVSVSEKTLQRSRLRSAPARLRPWALSSMAIWRTSALSPEAALG